MTKPLISEKTPKVGFWESRQKKIGPPPAEGRTSIQQGLLGARIVFEEWAGSQTVSVTSQGMGFSGFRESLVHGVLVVAGNTFASVFPTARHNR